MRLQNFALALSAGGIVAGLSLGAPLAQQPTEPGGAGASGTVTLPQLPVEAARVKKSTKRAAKAKKTPPAPAPVPPSARAEPRPETAAGPVIGYGAGRSATATKTDTPLSETPQSISVVGAEQIRDQGATTVQEALRYVPGVYADAYGNDNRGEYPRMRGGDPDMFLDGLRYSDAFSAADRLDPFTLERVEVLKGPSSMLYGQTSVAGLVNAISKRPQEETQREIGFEIGNYERLRVQTDWTGKLTEDGKWLYRFIAIGQSSNSQTDFVDNDRVLISPSLTYRPSTSTVLTLLARYQKDESGSMTSFLPHKGTIEPGYLGQRISRDRFVSEPGFDQYKTEATAISGLFEHKLNDAVTIRQNMRYWHTDIIYHSMYPDWASLSSDLRTVSRYIWMNDVVRDNFASDTNAEIKFRTGEASHRLLVGLDHRRIYQSAKWASGYDPTPFDLYNPVYNGLTPPPLTDQPDELQTQTGLYAQNQLRYGNWIGVLGVRHDWADNDVDGVGKEKVERTTYRAALMYKLPLGITPYVSFAQSFNPQYQMGCIPACAPYEGEQYEVGIKYKLTDTFTINAALYEVTEKNRLVYGTGYIPRAIGEARTRGGEIEFVGAVTSFLDIVGGYSYTEAIVTKGGADEEGKHVPTVPAHQASLWGKYKFEILGINGLSVGAGVRYVGESWGGKDEVRTPGVTLFDAMFGWEDDTWRFQIKGTNLEDKHYFATCLDRGDCFWGTGRTIISNLTYKF
ncbi:MAG: TonB-dependent siderophore receptor [Hyphomicrobiaceae bacterium]